MLVNQNTVYCLFMLVHSALTNINKYNFDLNNISEHVEISLN